MPRCCVLDYEYQDSNNWKFCLLFASISDHSYLVSIWACILWNVFLIIFFLRQCCIRFMVVTQFYGNSCKWLVGINILSPPPSFSLPPSHLPLPFLPLSPPLSPPSPPSQSRNSRDSRSSRDTMFFEQTDVYWEPPNSTAELYNQLAVMKYREIHRSHIR